MARRTSGRPNQAHVLVCRRRVRGQTRKGGSVGIFPHSRDHLVSQVPSTLAAGSLLSLLGPAASVGAVASVPDGGKQSG